MKDAIDLPTMLVEFFCIWELMKECDELFFVVPDGSDWRIFVLASSREIELEVFMLMVERSLQYLIRRVSLAPKVELNGDGDFPPCL
jgi:hypothetical protein